jgi:hypothetical protein
MVQVTTIGLDIAKHVFQAQGPMPQARFCSASALLAGSFSVS